MRRITKTLLGGILALLACCLTFAPARARLSAVHALEPVTTGVPQETSEPIRQKYQELRAEVMGAPVSVELDAAGGGRVRFYSNGAIYWSGETGAHALYGETLNKYVELGGEAGTLGYPVSDDSVLDSGAREVVFQHGFIITDPESGEASERYLPWVTFTPDGASVSDGAIALQRGANTALLMLPPQSGPAGGVSFSCQCTSQRLGNCTATLLNSTTVKCRKGTCTYKCAIVITNSPS